MRGAVLVTGVGIVHPLALDPDGLRRAVAAGRPPPCPRIADLDAVAPSGPTRRERKMDAVGRMARAAAGRALEHAGVRSGDGRVDAVVGGTAFGGLESCAAFDAELVERGPDFVTPAHFPNTAHNVACGHVAIDLGVRGPNLTLSQGLRSGLSAVVHAARLIRAGRATAVLAGGFDRWFPLLEDALGTRGLLPEAPPTEGAGLRPAEAACFLLLEREDHRASAAAPLGELLGWGEASPGPARDGLVRALRGALASGGVRDVDGVCAGVQGTERYDGAVRQAYREVLGAEPPWTLRPKSGLGETFGAAGPLAVASALLAGAPPHPRTVLVDGMDWGGGASAVVVRRGASLPPAGRRRS